MRKIDSVSLPAKCGVLIAGRICSLYCAIKEPNISSLICFCILFDLGARGGTVG